MHSSLFFKLFPPPKLMVMKHAGLHISDDAIRCLEYDIHGGTTTITKFGQTEFPEGLIEAGVVNDEKALGMQLKEFDRAHDLSYVKVAIPEEKSYLFQTDVSTRDVRLAAQNIEFKIEENVPLSAADSVFYFDLLPIPVSGGPLRASVSVVQRAYIEHLIKMLRTAGIFPIAFEVLPKAIARAVISPQTAGAQMIVYVMNHKTGVYVVSGGAVVFSSTIGWGAKTVASADSLDLGALTQEINRIYAYWTSHNMTSAAINRVVLVGREAPRFEDVLRKAVTDAGIVVVVGDVWQNILALDRYVPPIPREDSLDYAAAAGLAMSL